MLGSGIESVALGLVAAVVWGAGDFSGGLATKRTSAYSVVIVAHIASLLMLLVLASLFREAVPPLTSWLWGGAAGFFGGFGLILLYSALAGGRMSVAAPVSALVAAALPVVVAAFTQGLPGFLVLIGFALALAAIWLVSGSESDYRLADLHMPMIAGVSFGLFFICLHQASGESILWPLIAVRIVSISSLLGFALLTRQPILPTRASLLPIFMSSLLDTVGNGAFTLTSQLSRVDVAAVLSSLYPGSTVLLAWLLLKERISGKQILGIVTALTAIALITF